MKFAGSAPRGGLLRAYAGGLVVGAAMVGLVAAGALEPLESWSLDRLFELRGPRPPSAPVIIVGIDEASFVELDEQWPFPRAMHGRLIDAIARGRPVAIAVDLLFDVPSARGPVDDTALATAVAAAGNVVLGAAPEWDRHDAGAWRIEREVPNLPIPEIRAGAAAVAAVNLPQDSGGFIRRVPIAIPVAQETMPTLAARLHQMAAAAGWPAAALPARPVLVNFRGGPRTYPWVPYYQVLSGEVPPDVFRDTVVLVGPTSGLLHDVFPTPFARDGDMPGVEIHANALETLLRGDYLREMPRVVGAGLAAAAALAGTALVLRLRALRALLGVAAVWIALGGVTFAGFALGDVWVPGVAGSVALLAGYGVTVVDSFVREQRERRRLSQFFSPEVLREVVRHRDERGLGSTRRLVTCLFSDIRGFTSISEQLEPEQVAEMLREYLTEMTDIVFRHRGTVDKYIGDCVMALYNVPFEDPEHAVNAVRTALEFQERTLAVSARWQARLGVTVRNGVGINTGEAIVGALGSRQRLEYTAIGDAINLAARLESITKDFHTSIVISESTYRHVRGRFVIRELGDVTVKGRTQPVKVYAVLPGDLRAFPRAALEAAATLTLHGGGAATTVGTRDIGEGGLAVTGVPEGWEPGRVVQVRCEGGWLPKPLVAEGTIVWRRASEAGIAFRDRDADLAPMLGRGPRPGAGAPGTTPG